MILSCCLSLFVAFAAFKRKSLNFSGAVSAFLVGFVSFEAGGECAAALLWFFVSSSALTKWKASKKAKIEADFRVGGQRNWIQVLCNSLMANAAALLLLLQQHNVIARLIERETLLIVFLGNYAAAAGDTWASEIGSVFGGGKRPWLITTWRRVPVGTNGGVSLAGTLASAAGGATTALAFFLAQRRFEWLLHGVLFGATMGLVGSTIDSLLGATLQASWLETDGKVVEHNPSSAAKHICGRPVLDNHSVNLLATMTSALLAPGLLVCFSFRFFV